MAEETRAIHIGSIIHLQNKLPGGEDGGYLDARGRVTDKPVITKFQDPRIRGFVFTHERADRAEGSGSWKILSAEKKREGQPLQVGDKIHLLNMYPGAGYLDSFEWVENLDPFKDYHSMTIGVFTCSTPKRGDGPSGTWTVRSAPAKAAPAKANGQPVMEGDAIYLENDYPSAGFLHTYGDVTTHDLFKDYTGQRKFVFTAFSPGQTDPLVGSREWTISLDTPLDNLYRVQYRWGDESAPWHDGGVFRIGSRVGRPVVKLTLNSDDGGETLIGAVTYQGEDPISIEATRQRQNTYAIAIRQDDPSDAKNGHGEWRLGARDWQNISALDIQSNDDGKTLTGEMTYAGEGPCHFQGTRIASTTGDLGARWYEYAYPDLFRGRATRLEGVFETTYRLLADAFREIDGRSLNEALQSQGADEGKAQPGQTPVPSDDPSRAFQIQQLLHLYDLSQKLNAFFRDTLQGLIEQSLQEHRLAGTPAPFHLIRRCFQRVATDHEIIQQAAVQRRWNQDKDGKYSMSEQARELLVMDKLTIKAVAPFQHLLPDSDSSDADSLVIVSYLGERTLIHHAPYAPRFILIGVSYDRVPSAASTFDDTGLVGRNFPAAELLAIPHEVGHYMYHRAQLDETGTTFADLSEQFKDNPYYRWSEEIFADLYGCVVAGPLSALSMQALLAAGDKERAWKDDEEHPTPMLRVFILAEMLRVLKEVDDKRRELLQGTEKENSTRYNFSAMTESLDRDWAKILERWGYKRMAEGDGRPSRIFLPDPSADHLDKIVNADRVVTAVRPIIVEFAERLLNEASDDQNAPADDDLLPIDIPWSTNDYSTTEEYSHKMAELARSVLASRKTPDARIRKKVQEVKSKENTPDEKLRAHLGSWGDSGPTGFGGH